MGGELISVQRRDVAGDLILRVVESDRVAALVSEGWEVVPETNPPFDGNVPIMTVQRQLYNDSILNIKQANAGMRVPLSGTRKQQLAEAQRQADAKYGEGRAKVEY